MHRDNGIFASSQFRLDYDNKHKEKYFSGVGAQYQNSRLERSIQTIMFMARTFMVCSSLHWTYHGSDDISLWNFAVKHAVWLHNILPNDLSGITPIYFLASNKYEHRNLSISHVWGCTVFVLDPKLKNEQKIPKWNRRSQLGQFLVFP